jgi:hypothetical protein
MISPAFGPVADATEEEAAASIGTFVADVRAAAEENGQALGYEPTVGEPRRSPELDEGGRCGWTVEVNGQAVRVLMPGVPVGILRDMSSEIPALQINGEWAWWPTAVMWAVPLPARP